MGHEYDDYDEVWERDCDDCDDGGRDDDDVDCAGWFLEGSGRWVCEWVGSEICDCECPYSHWLGKTLKQIEKEEEAQ